MAQPDLFAGEATDALLTSYRTTPGIADELLDASGAMRPVWREFIQFFASLNREEVAERVSRGDQYLHDAGVFYRQYSAEDSSEREWPLSHVPVLIDEKEWSVLTDALVQRAELLEAVVADLYGDNHLIGEGLLPPGLVASSPEWLRPLVGVRPAAGHYLHFIAFEVGRAPDGTWRVLSDRTQAPAGSGFALENRMATSRAYSDLFPRINVHRLAGFFRAFRDQLQSMNRVPDIRTAILTPGPMNENYFEHAYIARYLGFVLVEGEDLTVQDGQAMLRTVAGLRPLGMVWRRVGSNLVDPLELSEASSIGTPGLVDAIREGHLNLVNALGTGILETRALLAYLPSICEAWRGEPLKMPNTASWWCGDPDWPAHAAKLDGHLLFSRAQTTNLPFDPNDRTVYGGINEALSTIAADRRNLVGQELATLSTTPAYVGNELRPRPMSLRVFLARTENGWQTMPGGFARIGRNTEATAVSLQNGGSVADVWIVSDNPVTIDTMTAPVVGSYVRPIVGALPSRAADNLYWLGRYSERAENMVRLLRAYHLRLAEFGDPDAALPTFVAEYLEESGLEPDQTIPKALVDTLASSIVSAGRVRDRFSVDGWAALHNLHSLALELQDNVVAGDAAARAMGKLLRGIGSFSGLVHENMYKSAGWRFLSIGRALEHAGNMTSIIANFADPEAPEGSLDMAIELGDSIMTYRRRYSVTTHRGPVVDLLVFDTLNPRSILFQLSELRAQVSSLPGAEDYGLMSPLSRALLKVHSGLALQTPESLVGEALVELEEDLGVLSDLLSEAYLQ
jgi:uncharacterized circularly permuted ATP-grasp superfamily protein/uncharacterized alpha-E superfamily protein